MPFVVGAIVCTLILAGFAVPGLLWDYKVLSSVKKWTETKDWGDVINGYEGNVGDKVGHTSKQYIHFSLGENPIFIALVVVCLLLILALFIFAWLESKDKVKENGKRTTVLVCSALAMPFIINIVHSIVYGYFVVFGLGTLLIIPTLINLMIWLGVKAAN